MPCSISRIIPLAGMVSSVPVLETVVQLAVFTDDGDDLLQLATFHAALVAKHLPLFSGRIRLAVPVNVITNSQIRGLSPLPLDRLVTKRAHRDLDVLFICRLTPVKVIPAMILATKRKRNDK